MYIYVRRAEWVCARRLLMRIYTYIYIHTNIIHGYVYVDVCMCIYMYVRVCMRMPIGLSGFVREGSYEIYLKWSCMNEVRVV